MNRSITLHWSFDIEDFFFVLPDNTYKLLYIYIYIDQVLIIMLLASWKRFGLRIS